MHTSSSIASTTTASVTPAQNGMISANEMSINIYVYPNHVGAVELLDAFGVVILAGTSMDFFSPQNHKC